MITDVEETITVGPPDLAAYRAELKEEAEKLISDKLPVTVAYAKNPGHHKAMGEGWQLQHLDAEKAARLIDGSDMPTLGVRLGPGGGIIDFDVDGPDEARALVDLFDGEPIAMPTYTSGRDGGEHRWAAFDDRLEVIGKATVKHKTANGDEITVRIGAGVSSKTGERLGAFSVAPPSWYATNKDPETGKSTDNWCWTSRRYAWKPGCSIDDIDPPALPDTVVEKLISAATPKKATTTRPLSSGSGEITGAVAAMLTSTKNQEDGGDGSKRLYTVACRAVELNLSDSDAVAAVRQYEAERPFPVDWSDAEVLQRVRDAETTVVRGAELVFANGVEFEVTDDKGKPKTAVAPLTMQELRREADAHFDRWPRRVGNLLFIDDPDHGVGWLESHEAVFGWYQSRRRVRWHGGKEAISRQNLYAELKRTAVAYEAVENLPHFPPMASHYYRCGKVTPGDGETLRRLVARFTPSTTIDRDLIVALIATAFWGGRSGARPAFVITSDAGRGAGKTTLVEMVAAVAGGLLDFAAGEDIETMKQRLLSPTALCKRVAMIDNVKRTRFSWAELEALVTTPMISGKRLYHGEAQRPNTLVWCVTLNGVALSTDLAQRSVIIKLDRATYSGSWKDETHEFIEKNRAALIADIAAFFEGERWPLPRASRWGAWEQDVLARMPEPGEAQVVILERQAECDADGDDGAMIDEYVAEQLKGCGYDPLTAQVRIPNQVLATWFIEAMGEPMGKTAVTRRLTQMASENQVKRLRSDKGRTHGRCFIYTGPDAQFIGEHIMNDLNARLPIHMRR